MKNLQRRFWLAAAGLSALAAGLALRQRSLGAQSSQGAALSALWSTEFLDASGRPCALASLRGRPLVVNFWATWCPPCVAEMPELDRLAQTLGTAGGQVLGIAVDKAEAVQAFLQRTPVAFPVVIGSTSGLALSRSLGNAAGGLPFSILVSADERLLATKVGASTRAELEAWSALARTA